MTTRIFRTVCADCERRAAGKAAATEGLQVLVVGCEHNHVAATLIAEGGLILNWCAWPAADVEAFARGSAHQVNALGKVLAMAADVCTGPNETNPGV